MFWTRELAGWLLTMLGVFAFGLIYFGLLRNNRIFEAVPMTVIAVMLFRGGIHLLKVAVAARVCRQADKPMAVRREVVKNAPPPRRAIPRV